MKQVIIDEGITDCYTDIINRAVKQISRTAYGKFLLERFPLRITSDTYYSDENKVLKQTGSPACTDGIEVYISPQTTAAFFEGMEFNQWEDDWSKYGEQLWTLKTTDKPHKLDIGEKVCEIRDIILHEYTHAINQHPKLQRAAVHRSKDYQQRLAVACEIQANDGLMGHEYARNYSQQPMGVTNKRQHPEVLDQHTLTDILRKLEMPQQMQMSSSASQSSEAMRQMMEATGAKDKWDRELQQESQRDGKESDQSGEEQQAEESKDKDSDGEQRGGRMSWLEKAMNKEAGENLVEQLSAKALAGIRNLLLTSLSKELSYDPSTDSVVYNQIRRHIRTKTYSRPSKKQSMISGGAEILKKGIRRKRITEYKETNDLLVLAVDASGSMSCQEKYVANIMGDLIQQVDKIAKEHDLDIKWENLLATLHTDTAKPLVSVKSDDWARTMRNYRACGGNDFDCVLRRVKDQLIVNEHRSYDSITILNLSDGLDVLDSSWEKTPLQDYIERGKLRWVDALIGNSRELRDAMVARERDLCKIREQVVLACDYR